MKLDEMGILGREAKISDDAPSRAGETGVIVTATTERAYIKFPDGSKEWFANKHIVGTRSLRKEAVEFQDFEQYPLTEMAAKKQCEHCGKTMAANHYWYKGGWKCKKAKPESEGSDKPASKAEPEKKDAPADNDHFPEMSDEAYDKLSPAGKAAQDEKEAAWYKRKGRTGPKDYTPKDDNEKAAHARAVKLHAQLTNKK